MSDLSIKNEIFPIAPNSLEARPWHMLLSSLKHAEVAAGDQMRKIGKELRSFGFLALPTVYESMCEEEYRHAILVDGICDWYMEPNLLTKKVYLGLKQRTEGFTSIVERMVVIHLVFEPSAISFLAYMNKNAYNIFSKEWADRMKVAFGLILKDESKHIKSSIPLIKGFFSALSREDKVKIQKSFKTHRAFLISGLHNYFRGFPEQKWMADEMIEKFNYVLNIVAKDVIYE